MLDRALHNSLAGPLAEIARRLAAKGVKPEAATLGGFGAGLLAAVLAGSGLTLGALFLLIVNRAAGLIEKALARLGEGGGFAFYLAVVCDAVFWGAFVLAFAFADSGAALVAAILLFALMTLASSALAFALAGARGSLAADPAGPGITGLLARLVEESEVTLAFVLMCVLPGYFAAIAVLLAAGALTTAAFRTLAAWRTFR